MGLVDLFIASSIPVLKVLLVTALGSYLALDRVDILGDDARKHLNNVSLQQTHLCVRVCVLFRVNQSFILSFPKLLCQQITFYIFSPALVSSNLAKTITYQSMVEL